MSDPKLRVRLDFRADLFACLNNSEWDFNIRGKGVYRNKSRVALTGLHANGSKSNIAILEAVDQVIGNQPEADLPVIHIPHIEHYFLTYSAEMRRFNRSDVISSETLFLVEMTHRQAACFTLKHGYLTFLKDGHVECSAKRVDSWEKFNMYPEPSSAHGLPIEAYCVGGENVQTIVDGIPLRVLTRIEMPHLINYCRNLPP